jgi:hypothetical protein
VNGPYGRFSSPEPEQQIRNGFENDDRPLTQTATLAVTETADVASLIADHQRHVAAQ